MATVQRLARTTTGNRLRVPRFRPAASRQLTIVKLLSSETSRPDSTPSSSVGKTTRPASRSWKLTSSIEPISKTELEFSALLSGEERLLLRFPQLPVRLLIL